MIIIFLNKFNFKEKWNLKIFLDSKYNYQIIRNYKIYLWLHDLRFLDKNAYLFAFLEALLVLRFFKLKKFYTLRRLKIYKSFIPILNMKEIKKYAKHSNMNTNLIITRVIQPIQ